MRNVVTQVHEKWRALSVLLNPGATTADLARLSDLLEIELPADVRRFYETVNGMVDHESAGESLEPAAAPESMCCAGPLRARRSSIASR